MTPKGSDSIAQGAALGIRKSSKPFKAPTGRDPMPNLAEDGQLCRRCPTLPKAPNGFGCFRGSVAMLRQRSIFSVAQRSIQDNRRAAWRGPVHNPRSHSMAHLAARHWRPPSHFVSNVAVYRRSGRLVYGAAMCNESIQFRGFLRRSPSPVTMPSCPADFSSA
jgi:hypothetical protein